jgi:hypothetical protein
MQRMALRTGWSRGCSGEPMTPTAAPRLDNGFPRVRLPGAASALPVLPVLGILLAAPALAAASADAAPQPPATPPKGAATAGVATAGVAPAGAAPAGAAPAGAAPAKPLNLRLGDLRSFMAPREWFTPLPAEIDEVIVRGRRRPEEIPERTPVPAGLGGLFWGVRNPTEAWRLLVPDPNVQLPPRGPDAPLEIPGAHRTRIGEPGKIY